MRNYATGAERSSDSLRSKRVAGRCPQGEQNKSNCYIRSNSRDSTRGADYAPWSAAVADVHRKSALCRSSFESLFGATEKQKTTRWVVFVFGAPPGTRTLDPLIKSQLLYQLS